MPRELSPTRMLEKYASDTKKKSAKKLVTLQTTSDAKNAADDAALKAKIAALESVALPSASFNSKSPEGSPVSAPTTTPDPFLLAGLIGAGALLLYLGTRK